MTKELQEYIDGNLEEIKESYGLLQKQKLLENLKSNLEEAEFEVDKINAYTAPEEKKRRKEAVEYYEEMIKGLEKMLEE